MAAELHIKDSYYFEVPKFLYRYNYRDKSEFPSVWVKNDPEFQLWEMARQYGALVALQKPFSFELPALDELKADYAHWKDADHANFGKPFDAYLDVAAAALKARYAAERSAETAADQSFSEWLAKADLHHSPAGVASVSEFADAAWYAKVADDPSFQKAWTKVKSQAGSIKDFNQSDIAWSPDKIAAYNHNLSGKIVLSFQPFGELRNLYETKSGFGISKFMVIEVAVGLIMLWLFSSVARKIAGGGAPTGKLWNLLETFLVFIRDEVARKAIGGHEHHDEHAPPAEGVHHPEPGRAVDEHNLAGPLVVAASVSKAPDNGHASHSHGAASHEHGAASHAASHAHEHAHPADRFVPLLWTIFFFILGCNLMGMLPWLGAPSGSFRTTLALAAVTFSAVVFYGSLKFGVIGFWINQIPSMELPLPLAILLKPPIFLIEVLGLFIKHGVLAIRLLANMVAGHLVLLTIMTLAFSLEGAMNPNWTVTAVAAVIGSTALSCLELFVAFLQAYVFTLLSALFIGAATHKH